VNIMTNTSTKLIGRQKSFKHTPVWVNSEPQTVTYESKSATPVGLGEPQWSLNQIRFLYYSISLPKRFKDVVIYLNKVLLAVTNIQVFTFLKSIKIIIR